MMQLKVSRLGARAGKGKGKKLERSIIRLVLGTKG